VPLQVCDILLSNLKGHAVSGSLDKNAHSFIDVTMNMSISHEIHL